MTKDRALGIVGTFLLAAACAACSGGDEGAPGADGLASGASSDDGAESNAALEVVADRSAIVRRTGGGTIAVQVHGTAAAGATLDIEGLPSGIAAKAGQGKLDLSFSGEPQLGTHVIKVRAKSGADVREASVSLLVADDAGALDTTFAAKGLLSGIVSMKSQRMTLDAQGRSLAAGNDAAVKGFVARYTSDGEPDTTFDGDGIASVSFDPVELSLLLGTASRNGEVFVGGARGSFGSAIAPCIAKLDESGKPATDFGKDGVACFVSPQLGDVGIIGEMIALDDGSLLAMGVGGTMQDQDVIVLKVTAKGELDSSFGVGGVARWVAPTSDGPGKMLVDANGRVLVAGYYYDKALSKPFAFVMRLTESGQPDPWFGNAGLLSIDTKAMQASSTGMTLGPNGEIYVAAVEGQSAAIYAFEPEKGEPLASFGNGGTRAYPELGNGGRFATIAWDDGKLLATGSVTSGAETNAALVRVTAMDGALDATFGQGGMTKMPVGTEAPSMAIASSSRVMMLIPTQTSYVIARAWR